MISDNTFPIWDKDTGIQDFKDGESDELTSSEIMDIRENWIELKKQLKGDQNLSDFNERLKREWAIETGVIENLYDIDRGVTQSLIEHGFKAELIHHGSTNKSRGYVLQLLKDQEASLEGVFDFIKDERKLTTSYVKELHASLVRSQNTTEAMDPLGQRMEVPLIKGDWKTQDNHPVRDGMKYLYCPTEHVGSEMDRLINFHSTHVRNNVSSEVQAAWLHHRFTQIHPFQDGNGRVARTLASLILIKDDLFPLVITRDGRHEYIEALEDADEGDLGSLVAVFVKSQKVQFRRASEIIGNKNHDTRSALELLREAAKARRSKSQRKTLNRVLIVQRDLKKRLELLIPDIKAALKEIDSSYKVQLRKSNDKNNHYFRHQIIETAKRMKYYANLNTSDKSWVGLQVKWSRQAYFVFSIHGIWRQHHNKALICSPFLEFKDVEEGNEVRTSLIQVAEDGFLFFQSENENEKQLQSRFNDWLGEVIDNFILELARNL